jgi:hypothetical protein
VQAQQIADAGRRDRSPAESDYRGPPFENPREVPQLELAEARLALAVEQLGDCLARRALDLVVEVVKVTVKAFRDLPADGALAGAHEPD